TPVDDASFAAAVTRVAHAAEMVNRTAAPDDRVTQFEALTAAAYHELARRGVEVAVIEAGLGGRWDATNVIPSKVQVVTSIGLEHTRWLGPTLADIASEKLAVVRDHSTLVAADLPEEAEAVVEQVVAERHARLVRSTLDGPAPGRALGSFQRQNFALAQAAAGAFLGSLDPRAVALAAAEVEVPGRLELVSPDGPLVFYDGAHNPAGAEALAAALPEVVAGRRLVAVIGVLDDKDAASMLRAILPLADAAVYTRSANPRSLSPATLEGLAAQLGGPPSECVADPRAAVERARALAGPEGAVIATGSIYLIADLVRERQAARASRL
ncbi:MAG: dihydrofolate synthase / folylpolyglutamate synthase, partial [Thermoleophilaceae bacterium]|nr:dihydrofolate synthase / folylpolyglutamate synthase [Thermoleophilaceae bacterium]